MQRYIVQPLMEKKLAPKNTDYDAYVRYTAGQSGYGRDSHMSDTCVMSWARGWAVLPARIIVEYVWKIDVAKIKADYGATRIVVRSIDAYGAWSKGIGFVGAAALSIGLATPEAALVWGPSDIPGEALPSFLKNTYYPAVDVTGYSYVLLVINQDIFASLDHYEHHVAGVTVYLQVETPVAIYTVTVKVVDDKGFAVKDAKVTVDELESGFTDTYGNISFDLVSGKYTARASKTMPDGAVWTGQAAFSVPEQRQVTVTLSPPKIWYEQLIWVGVAGVAVVAAIAVIRTIVEARRK